MHYLQIDKNNSWYLKVKTEFFRLPRLSKIFVLGESISFFPVLESSIHFVSSVNDSCTISIPGKHSDFCQLKITTTIWDVVKGETLFSANSSIAFVVQHDCATAQ